MHICRIGKVVRPIYRKRKNNQTTGLIIYGSLRTMSVQQKFTEILISSLRNVISTYYHEAVFPSVALVPEELRQRNS